MSLRAIEPDIANAALIIVDMQNDFLHPDGAFGQRARRQPERLAGMSPLSATIPVVKRLLDSFRDTRLPIVHIITTHQPDYADAQWPHWRSHGLTSDGQALLLEGSWGAQIVDELTPRRGEYVVAKKGYGGFANPAQHNPAFPRRDHLRRRRDYHSDLRIIHDTRRR